MARLGRLLPSDSNPELFEWIAVTLILTLAFLVILQAIGPQVQQAFDWLGETLVALVS